jgi:hypothetical protein
MLVIIFMDLYKLYWRFMMGVNYRQHGYHWTIGWNPKDFHRVSRCMQTSHPRGQDECMSNENWPRRSDVDGPRIKPCPRVDSSAMIGSSLVWQSGWNWLSRNHLLMLPQWSWSRSRSTPWDWWFRHYFWSVQYWTLGATPPCASIDLTRSSR